MVEESLGHIPSPPICKHSGFGIASFVIALLVGTLELLAFAASLFLQQATPGGLRRTSPVTSSLASLCAAAWR